MNDGTLAIASDFVKTGIEKAGIPLSGTLEAYLSITFARYIGNSINVDLLTIRVTQAMDLSVPLSGMPAFSMPVLTKSEAMASVPSFIAAASGGRRPGRFECSPGRLRPWSPQSGPLRTFRATTIRVSG